MDFMSKEGEEHVQLFKEHFLKSQQMMKVDVDKHKRERKFDVGDWVFLKLQSYTQKSVK